ncbi:unnamed protein product [Acanthosepion pharaonis]|uniref:Uncharacterized protein n=1 Tax=Acanthosepion pharaonis TaxID=158019 RepID=A0A812DUB6_ACAPH|nr:unnamed protein product [Sepia pharaonis]
MLFCNSNALSYRALSEPIFSDSFFPFITYSLIPNLAIAFCLFLSISFFYCFLLTSVLILLLNIRFSFFISTPNSSFISYSSLIGFFTTFYANFQIFLSRFLIISFLISLFLHFLCFLLFFFSFCPFNVILFSFRRFLCLSFQILYVCSVRTKYSVGSIH